MQQLINSELYIKTNDLRKKLRLKLKRFIKKRSSLVLFITFTAGNNGLGLYLLGVGDQVLPLDVYNEIKVRTLSQVRGTVQADILKKIKRKTLVFSLQNLHCV
jgi:methylmalonyl-CoA mutase